VKIIPMAWIFVLWLFKSDSFLDFYSEATDFLGLILFNAFGLVSTINQPFYRCDDLRF
jgi:hypothetical protein